ncbi:PEP-CTERM sorting domain-containing protein [Aeoliella sp. SH292]|uniref:PEP-CTERM sorting domain-containing protein n=1 Tax=Aeoliella sp. SH292 TaxID=3454464 RepID=UPI003F9CB6B5
MLRTHSRISAIASIGFASLLAASTASAQHDHGDVDFSYDSGKIAIEFGDEGRVFEGEFVGPDSGFYKSEDPGFGSEVDEGLGIDPLDYIGFNVLGPLVFHDGNSFVPTSATLTIEGAANTDVEVSSSTMSGSGLVGRADAGGTIHSHIDFVLADSAPIGAYGLLLSLSAFDEFGQPKLGVADSDPFYLVLNRGLEEEVFEGAVGAFAAQVPEPTSLALLGVGLAVWAVRRKRAA